MSTEHRIPYDSIAHSASTSMSRLWSTPPIASLPYMDELKNLVTVAPHLIADSMQEYDSLIAIFNTLSASNSPHLALFPHSIELKNVLHVFKNTDSLPTFDKMASADPQWKTQLQMGVDETVELVGLGMYMANKKQQKNTLSATVRVRDSDMIVTPARETNTDGSKMNDLTRLKSIAAHIAERVFFAYLRENGIMVRKDMMNSVFDEMIQYTRLMGNPSPLEEVSLQLGWITMDKFKTLQQKFTDLTIN